MLSGWKYILNNNLTNVIQYKTIIAKTYKTNDSRKKEQEQKTAYHSRAHVFTLVVFCGFFLLVRYVWLIILVFAAVFPLFLFVLRSVLCVKCSLCLWIVHSWLRLQFSLTWIGLIFLCWKGIFLFCFRNLVEGFLSAIIVQLFFSKLKYKS